MGSSIRRGCTPASMNPRSTRVFISLIRRQSLDVSASTSRLRYLYKYAIQHETLAGPGEGPAGNQSRSSERRDRYLANSPIFNFDRIVTPLLIGQGSGDGDLIPSDAIFEGLKRLNEDVEYRIYENEGHVLSSKPDVLDFWRRRLDFLAEHLRLVLDPNGGIVFDGDRAKVSSQ